MIRLVDDIPKDSRRRYNWEHNIAKLKAANGGWGIVVPDDGVPNTNTAAQAVSRNIRNGRIKGIKPGEFDALTRGTTIYARYVGGDKDVQ